MIETSSSLPRKSSAIFGNLRKFSENVRDVSLSEQLQNLPKSSEIGRKSSENRQKRRHRMSI